MHDSLIQALVTATPYQCSAWSDQIMDTGQLLDGKALAVKLRKKVAADLKELQASIPGFQPQLSIVQVSCCKVKGWQEGQYSTGNNCTFGDCMFMAGGVPATSVTWVCIRKVGSVSVGREDPCGNGGFLCSPVSVVEYGISVNCALFNVVRLVLVKTPRSISA